jgi:dTDP-4-dehydrorhamnose 3,5-epimerase-like enzyme
MKPISMAKFRFVGRISKMGKNNRVIWIPREYHDKILGLEDKDIRIMIDDEIWDLKKCG